MKLRNGVQLELCAHVSASDITKSSATHAYLPQVLLKPFDARRYMCDLVHVDLMWTVTHENYLKGSFSYRNGNAIVE